MEDETPTTTRLKVKFLTYSQGRIQPWVGGGGGGRLEVEKKNLQLINLHPCNHVFL